MVKDIYYRQGDVIIRKVKPIDGNKGEKLNHLILAKGEVTGHAHRITQGQADLYQFNNMLYLTVLSAVAKLEHEEHKEIDLPKGDYEINIQRSYEPQSWRQVTD